MILFRNLTDIVLYAIFLAKSVSRISYLQQSTNTFYFSDALATFPPLPILMQYSLTFRTNTSSDNFGNVQINYYHNQNGFLLCISGSVFGIAIPLVIDSVVFVWGGGGCHI